MAARGTAHPIGSTVFLPGAASAALAAVLFGLTTPVIQRFGRELGTFGTAALLYGGAALTSLPFTRRRGSEAPVRAVHLRRLLAVALFGAVLAPGCLVWGLQKTRATTASLMLNTEAVFTVILARLLFREHVGRRVLVAVGLMLTGGALLIGAPGEVPASSIAGTLAVGAAALAWAADNSLTRPLADLDPTRVVLVKASLGAALSLLFATALEEPLPRVGNAVGIAACGALGYGVSLRFYLLAQRKIGAGRTGSVFALAPFIGAAAAWIMGDRGLATSTWVAGILFMVGVFLHLTEHHAHPHQHEAVEHEHAHRHDDGHHDHLHDAHIEAAHSHVHRHAPIEHSHPHAPDLHHQHDHADRG